MFANCHLSMRGAIVFATVLAFSAAALGAEPAAQDAEPAVSGEDLQNLDREEQRAQPPAQPSADPSTVAPSTADSEPRPARASAVRTDRIELDATAITGNRELPKVLYIVPWKKADIGELPAQPFNTLLDEALMPVDRDVFRREVTYFDAVSGGADANQSTSGQPP